MCIRDSPRGRPCEFRYNLDYEHEPVGEEGDEVHLDSESSVGTSSSAISWSMATTVTTPLGAAQSSVAAPGAPAVQAVRPPAPSASTGGSGSAPASAISPEDFSPHAATVVRE